LCDVCPRVPNPDINRFGCDTYTKQCSCSRPKTLTASCSSNAECHSQGSVTQCALVRDFTTGRSYGTMECQTCRTQAVCLITDGARQIGKCSCLQQGIRLQTCLATELLTTIMTDGTALCGVTTAAHSSRSMQPFIPWHSLAAAPCAITNKANAQCFRTDTMGYLVVGHGTVQGRRLLEESGDEEPWELDLEILDFPLWNHTADPCRMLAKAHFSGEHLSISEEAALESCVKTRQFGNFTINALNLTSLAAHDNFLLSFTDFFTAASQRGVLRQLLKTEGLLHFVITQNSVTKAWLDTFTSFSIAVALLYDRNWSQLGGGNATTATNATNATLYSDPEWYKGVVSSQLGAMYLLAPVSSMATMSTMYTMSEHFLQPAMTTTASERTTTAYVPPPPQQNVPPPRQNVPPPQQNVPPPRQNVPPPQQNVSPPQQNVPVSSSRRLLDTSDDAIFRYSTLTAATDGFSNIPLGSAMADSWLEGPFGWPPRMDKDDWDGSEECTAAQVALGIFGDAGLVMNSFFAPEQPSKQELTWGLVENLPSTYTIPTNHTNASVSAKDSSGDASGDWASVFFLFIAESVVENYLGIGPTSIKTFFTSAPEIPRDILTARNLAKDMLMCDFESVMLCSRHNRRIFVSLILSYLLYLIIATLLGFVGLRGLAGSLFYLIPFIALWLSYGLSPMCIPMIPTCILSDIIESVQVILPAKITWPDALQVPLPPPPLPPKP
jgi:hypothetical protein